MRVEGQKVTYFGMPMGMWALFAPSFRKQLTAVFGHEGRFTKCAICTHGAKAAFRPE